MPAGVAVDTTSIEAFREFIDADFDPQYLLFVANQFGKRKIGVYAFGKSKTADYTPPKRPTTRRAVAKKPKGGAPASAPAQSRPARPVQTP